ncbi:MAG: hypothetical protein ACLTSX_11930 [Collinsella sp.]
MTEQQSLFGDMATDDGARTDDASATTESPQDVRAQAAARAAELRHLLDYHAYRYYALDAPGSQMPPLTICWSSSSRSRRPIPSSSPPTPTPSVWAVMCPSSSRLSRIWRACIPWTTP